MSERTSKPSGSPNQGAYSPGRVAVAPHLHKHRSHIHIELVVHPMRGANNMRELRRVVLVASIAGLVGLVGATPAAGQYPLTLTTEAVAKTATTSVVTRIVIRVERLMVEASRTRVTDALKFSGYGAFLNALRALPPIGSIEVEARKVDLRYAREVNDEKGRRLVLVGDRPLFFLGGGDLEKSRAGFELTLVELRLEADGHATGTMMGAARLKPAGDEVVLDDFADVPVQLTTRISAR